MPKNKPNGGGAGTLDPPQKARRKGDFTGFGADSGSTSTVEVATEITGQPATVDSKVLSDTAEKQQQRAQSRKLGHRAALSPFPKVVESLVNLIGAPLTAYLGGVNETRAVRQWMNSERLPHAITQSKLKLALQVAVFLQNEGEEEVIAAWFLGLNPALDDQTPADLIRSAGGTEELSAILAAAREFVDN
jgi:hypothetical protein